MRALVGRVVIVVGVLLATPAIGHSQSVTAAWDPNPPTDLVLNYQVCVGTLPFNCTLANASVPAVQTSYTFTPNAGTLYYVAVRAVSAIGPGGYTNAVSVSTPALTNVVNRTNTVGAAVSVGLSAIDPDGGTLRFSHTGLPFGLTLNQTSGVISGTPTAEGTFNVTILVNDGLATTSASFTWTILPVPSVSAISVAPASGSASSQSFTAQYGDNLGAADIQYAYLKFSTTPTGSTNTCMVRYDRAANRMSLRDNAGNWQTGVVPGSSTTQQNSQCSVSFAGSSASTSGTTLTMTVAMTFAGTYAGDKNTYLYASNPGGYISDWQQRGTWTIPSGGAPPPPPPPPPNGPTVGPVSPDAGSWGAQVFSAQYSDPLGVTDLQYVYLRIATGPTGPTNTCMVRYDRAAATMSLRDNDGNWMPPRTFSMGGTQRNSQCTVWFAGSSATVSGQTLTLNVAFTFSTAYAGAKNIYSYAQTITGVVTGWQLRGTWTVPSSPVTADYVTPNSGSGSTGTFAARFTDLAGVGDLSAVYLRFATTASGPTNVCMVRYEPWNGRISLRADNGTWLPGATIVQGGTQQNSQCSISVAMSSVAVTGPSLTLTVPVTFTPAYAGAKSIYMYASTTGGAITDWQQRGTWTIP